MQAGSSQEMESSGGEPGANHAASLRKYKQDAHAGGRAGHSQGPLWAGQPTRLKLLHGGRAAGRGPHRAEKWVSTSRCASTAAAKAPACSVVECCAMAAFFSMPAAGSTKVWARDVGWGTAAQAGAAQLAGGRGSSGVLVAVKGRPPAHSCLLPQVRKRGASTCGLMQQAVSRCSSLRQTGGREEGLPLLLTEHRLAGERT